MAARKVGLGTKIAVGVAGLALGGGLALSLPRGLNAVDIERAKTAYTPLTNSRARVSYLVRPGQIPAGHELEFSVGLKGSATSMRIGPNVWTKKDRNGDPFGRVLAIPGKNGSVRVHLLPMAPGASSIAVRLVKGRRGTELSSSSFTPKYRAYQRGDVGVMADADLREPVLQAFTDEIRFFNRFINRDQVRIVQASAITDEADTAGIVFPGWLSAGGKSIPWFNILTVNDPALAKGLACHEASHRVCNDPQNASKLSALNALHAKMAQAHRSVPAEQHPIFSVFDERPGDFVGHPYVNGDELFASGTRTMRHNPVRFLRDMNALKRTNPNDHKLAVQAAGKITGFYGPGAKEVFSPAVLSYLQRHKNLK